MPVDNGVLRHTLGGNLSAVIREKSSLENLLLIEIAVKVKVVVNGLHNGIINICAGDIQPADEIVILRVKGGVFVVDCACRELFNFLCCRSTVFQLNKMRGSSGLASVLVNIVVVTAEVFRKPQNQNDNRANQHNKRREKHDFPHNLGG